MRYEHAKRIQVGHITRLKGTPPNRGRLTTRFSYPFPPRHSRQESRSSDRCRCKSRTFPSVHRQPWRLLNIALHFNPASDHLTVSACVRPSILCAGSGELSIKITDDGAAALGAILAGKIGLRSVDLRGNRVSKQVLPPVPRIAPEAPRVCAFTIARHVSNSGGQDAWDDTPSCMVVYIASLLRGTSEVLVRGCCQNMFKQLFAGRKFVPISSLIIAVASSHPPHRFSDLDGA